MEKTEQEYKKEYQDYLDYHKDSPYYKCMTYDEWRN